MSLLWQQPKLNPRLVLVALAVDNVASGNVFLRVLIYSCNTNGKKHLKLKSYFYLMTGLSLKIGLLMFANSWLRCCYWTEIVWVEISWTFHSSEEKKCLRSRSISVPSEKNKPAVIGWVRSMWVYTETNEDVRKKQEELNFTALYKRQKGFYGCKCHVQKIKLRYVCCRKLSLLDSVSFENNDVIDERF